MQLDFFQRVKDKNEPSQGAAQIRGRRQALGFAVVLSLPPFLSGECHRPRLKLRRDGMPIPGHCHWLLRHTLSPAFGLLNAESYSSRLSSSTRHRERVRDQLNITVMCSHLRRFFCSNSQKCQSRTAPLVQAPATRTSRRDMLNKVVGQRLEHR